jgi:hypothetical protein
MARMRPTVQTPVLTINKYVNTLGLGIKATSRHDFGSSYLLYKQDCCILLGKRTFRILCMLIFC